MWESPLSRAEDAKRRRDIGAEVGALIEGHGALTGAPWYPSRAGDRLTVTLGATQRAPQWTDAYEVVWDAEHGRVLRALGCEGAEDSAGGWYAGPPELYGSDPVEQPWMEAGPDWLTLVRGGRVVHQGRHAAVPSPVPEKLAPVDSFVFDALQFIPLHANGEHVTERALNMSVHGQVLYVPDPAARWTALRTTATVSASGTGGALPGPGHADR
ncbi:hypothetical protein [Streptomyces sp. NPDC046821]|uniref:hypothetical protein n=1 Tax=Streptomyces sp. NPDC046821 TaxID=3154702 RepID=UPI0034059464